MLVLALVLFSLGVMVMTCEDNYKKDFVIAILLLMTSAFFSGIALTLYLTSL